MEKLIYTYLGRWIERQTDEVRNGKEGADARFDGGYTSEGRTRKDSRRARSRMTFSCDGSRSDEQPIGWEPDINDGVRLNIRPWLTAKVHQLHDATAAFCA